MGGGVLGPLDDRRSRNYPASSVQRMRPPHPRRLRPLGLVAVCVFIAAVCQSVPLAATERNENNR